MQEEVALPLDLGREGRGPEPQPQDFAMGSLWLCYPGILGGVLQSARFRALA